MKDLMLMFPNETCPFDRFDDDDANLLLLLLLMTMMIMVMMIIIMATICNCNDDGDYDYYYEDYDHVHVDVFLPIHLGPKPGLLDETFQHLRRAQYDVFFAGVLC